MANTKTIAEALSVARLNRQGEADLAAYIANIALEYMWNSYDWRESLFALPPFWVIPGEQEYGAPFYAIPEDFRGLREAYIVQTTSVPPNRRELKVQRDIRLTNVMGLPQDIGYEAATGKLRLFPRVPNNIAASQYLVDGTYKARAPQVTASTLQNTVIPWDDEYFHTFVAALKWASAAVNDSPQEEQRFQKMSMLVDKMAAREGLDLGDPSLAPAEPLVVPQEYYSPWLAL